MEDPRDTEKRALNKYAKYSSMVFQMGAIIFGFTYAGIWLDEKYNRSPLFTTIFALASIFLAIYYTIKDFIKKK
jgi:hypothetical protein